MRIIAGQFGSRRLHSSRGLALRPTSDRLRETLFDILQTRVEKCFFVDGYAGTGAVGIEALSRGARHVAFLENHRSAVALIRRNLDSLGLLPSDPARHSHVEILPVDVCHGLVTLAARVASTGPVDILFFDPPYAEPEEIYRVLDVLAGSPLVAAHSLIVLERGRKTALPATRGPFLRVRTVVQGDAALDFFTPG